MLVSSGSCTTDPRYGITWKKLLVPMTCQRQLVRLPTCLSTVTATWAVPP